MFRHVVLSFVACFAISELSARGQDAIPKPPSPPAAAPASDADLAARVAALEKEVADLKQSKKELVDIVNNHSIMLHDAVADHATPDGGKHYVPNVQAIRDDRDSRRDLVDTVMHDMTRSTGELQIRNDMDSGQSLLINGLDKYYVAPHSARTVTVPSGTATTELAGEGVKSWMIGAPNYSQEIVIAPAVRTNLVTADAWRYDPVTGVWWRDLR